MGLLPNRAPERLSFCPFDAAVIRFERWGARPSGELSAASLHNLLWRNAKRIYGLSI